MHRSATLSCRRMLCATALLVCMLPAAGQAQEVFAPFPSRIRIATRDPDVRISWDDTSDLAAQYLIYRHTEEITLDTVDDAELVGVVDEGVESYIDTPPEPGAYYYAVLAQDTDGTIYEILVPFRNSFVEAVTIENVSEAADVAARAQDLRAIAGDTAITISFSVGGGNRTLALYRSVEPVRSTADLADATQIATIPSSQTEYVDYAVPGVGYYYSVLDTELIARGRFELVPGENTTTRATEIALPDTAVATGPSPSTAAFAPSRSRPLPFFQIQNAVELGSTVFGAGSIAIPDEQPLAAETDKAVIQLIRMANRQAEAAPTVETLPVDRSVPPDEDGAKSLDTTLRSIVTGPMSQSSWAEAELMLTNFVRLPLTDELRYRAAFYLGQVYYFQEEYRRAALAFLTAQEGYYPEATRWLDRALKVSPDE